MSGSADVGIVLVTHGDYGASLLAAAGAIVGELAGVQTVAIRPGDSQGDVGRKVADAVRRADAGAGVLVMSDLCGSTPGNACVQVSGDAARVGGDVRVVFGLSLAMLMKLASTDRRGSPPARLAELCAETARKSVLVATGDPNRGGVK